MFDLTFLGTSASVPSAHQRLADRRELPQKTDPDAGRLLTVVFEAIAPVGVVGPQEVRPLRK